jgi:hypothetical protein
MTSASASRKRRAAQAARSEASRESGVRRSRDRWRQVVVTWVVDRDPVVALFDADRLIRDLENRAMPELVAAARAAGYTWADIGEALGVSRQGAHSRFGGADD